MKKEICDRSMSFDECELAILRVAIDKAEKQLGKDVVNSPETIKIVNIVENFLRRKKLVAYGGTAINSILPKEDQFYNMEYELPDYDFFTPNALDDAKELCDIYVKEGFAEVEAKNGVHEGTYKVYVNFMPVADVTYLHKDIFNAIKKEAIRVAGIYYAPPNFLRMSMYLELSRPAGEISRWEKVLKRLTLLNKNYPLKAHNCGEVDFERKMEDRTNVDEIYETVRDTLIDQGVVFFGGYAMTLYSSYMPKALQRKFEKNPDFDVLSEDPETTAEIVKERLEDIGLKGVKIVKKPAIGEIVAPHYEIRVGPDTVAFIYQPIACHSYNVIKIHGSTIKIATIDTMLSFYLAFLYAARDYYDPDRILCMAQYLFKVQQRNRLRQKGLLKRFSINCYGHQLTMEEIRAQKSEKYMELRDRRGTREYEEYFLRYRPGDDVKTKKRENTEKVGKTDKIKTVRRKMHGKKTKKRGRGGLFY
jgi:hypothetical protein